MADRLPTPRVRLNFGTRSAQMVAAVSLALERAASETLLDGPLDTIEGPTGRRYRRFVRGLAERLPGSAFLEVSLAAGASAVLCAAGVNKCRTAVINVGTTVSSRAIAANRELLGIPPHGLIELRGQDEVARGRMTLGQFDVLHYWGTAQPGEIETAFATLQPVLNSCVVVLLRDWNFYQIRSDFAAAAESLSYRTVYAAELRTTMDNEFAGAVGRDSDWDNGYGVFVMEKQAVTPEVHADLVDRMGMTKLSLFSAALGSGGTAVFRQDRGPPTEEIEYRDFSGYAAKVVKEFESLGDNCEFAQVQRQLGVEQISLLRWAGLSYERLMDGLRTGFASLLDESAITTDLHGTEGTREYLVYHHGAGMMYHTYRYEKDYTAEQVLASQGTYLRYLRQKFLDDLMEAEKLYVWKALQPPSLEQVEALVASLRSHGPNSLLWVCEASAPEQVGSVERLSDHLFRGYIDRISLTDIAYGSWFKVCVAAKVLWRPDP